MRLGDGLGMRLGDGLGMRLVMAGNEEACCQFNFKNEPMYGRDKVVQTI